MGLKSMTGFASREGRFEAETACYTWTWDIRSVNGKSLDMRLRLPPYLNDMDQMLRKQVSGVLARGNVQISLNIKAEESEQALSIDEALASRLIAFSDKMSKAHDIAPLTMDGLLSLRGVVDQNSDPLNEDEATGLRKALTDDFKRAMDALVDARQREGEALQTVLARIVSETETHVNALKDAPERGADAIRDKLKKQVEVLRQADGELNEERLCQEALLLAAKADIQEEIDRLEAHIAAARDLLSLDEPVGRRFDFLSQEFNREANTVCSKANDIAVTTVGLALKNSIDQLREQVQNVE